MRKSRRLLLRSNGLNGCDPSSSTVTSSGLFSLKPTTAHSLSKFSSTKYALTLKSLLQYSKITYKLRYLSIIYANSKYDKTNVILDISKISNKSYII